jgi:hypothetical protein
MMKRLVHGLLGLLLLLVVLGHGVALIHMAYSPACWAGCLETLQTERGWGLLAGLALVGLLVAYLVTGVRPRSGGDQYLSFTRNGATVSILLRAVTDYIARIGDEFAAIVAMKPRVRPRGRTMEVDLELRLKAGTQIPELCQMLQERVRERLAQDLGLTDIKRIRVQVKEIVGEPEPADPMVDGLGA